MTRLRESDLEMDIVLSAICRDERCEDDSIHAQHPIEDTPKLMKERQRRLGWVRDPLEPVPDRARRDVMERPHILDACVVEVVSSVVPKSMGMIRTDLENTYGECGLRRLYRCLERLSKKRSIVRVDLSRYQNGADLSAYLQPHSRLIREPALCFRQLTDYFESSAGLLPHVPYMPFECNEPGVRGKNGHRRVVPDRGAKLHPNSIASRLLLLERDRPGLSRSEQARIIGAPLAQITNAARRLSTAETGRRLNAAKWPNVDR